MVKRKRSEIENNLNDFIDLNDFIPYLIEIIDTEEFAKYIFINLIILFIV